MLSGYIKMLKKHSFLQTGERDKFPADRDNRPNDRDENTSDRDVYPGHVFTLTGHRDKNTGEWDAFLTLIPIAIGIMVMIQVIVDIKTNIQ